jgi:hypothetical protein
MMFNMKLSGDDHESDVETPKLIEQRHAITNAPRQPIEAVNEDLIDLAAPNVSKQSVQRRTIERRSRIAVVVKPVGQERPAVLSLGLQIQPARLVLDIVRRQRTRGTHRLAGVDRPPNWPSAQRPVDLRSAARSSGPRIGSR